MGVSLSISLNLVYRPVTQGRFDCIFSLVVDQKFSGKDDVTQRVAKIRRVRRGFMDE